MEIKQLNTEIDKLTSDPTMDRLLREKRPHSSGTAIAILALLVAMAAVLATGWQWWQTRTVVPEEDTQTETITQLQETQKNISTSLASVEERLAAAHSPIDADELSRREERLKAVENQLAGLQGQEGQDQSTINAMQGSVRSLEQRLSATESGLVSVAASSQNSSVALDLAEIDFLLRTANERLQLFADPAAADGNEAERRLAFAEAYRLLSNRISIFVSLPMRGLDKLGLQRRLDEIGRKLPESA